MLIWQVSATPRPSRQPALRMLTGSGLTLWCRQIRGWNAMAPTKQQILDSLAKVPSPDGAPLTTTGALSDVVVTDGKVFFSISVDAGEVQRWESVRKRAEEAVRAVPGVQSALVALTAERKPGAAAARPAPAAGPKPRATAHGGEKNGGVPRVEAVIALAPRKSGGRKTPTPRNLALRP